MVRRTRLQSKTDDLAFPIRVKFVVPSGGLGLISSRIEAWLRGELAHGDYAQHSAQGIGAHATAIYFRQTEDVRRFVAAFPELELADGTRSPAYYSPATKSRV